MVGIIKLFKNITSLMNVKEFRQRFISTTILSFLFLLLILLGNPYVSIFFSILFSFVFFEYEKLNSKVLDKSQVCNVLFLQIILLFFTIFKIYEIEIASLFFNNNISFLLTAVFFNIIFLLYKKSNFIKFLLSNLIIVSFFSLIVILQFPNGLYTIF